MGKVKPIEEQVIHPITGFRLDTEEEKRMPRPSWGKYEKYFYHDIDFSYESLKISLTNKSRKLDY